MNDTLSNNVNAERRHRDPTRSEPLEKRIAIREAGVHDSLSAIAHELPNIARLTGEQPHSVPMAVFEATEVPPMEPLNAASAGPAQPSELSAADRINQAQQLVAESGPVPVGQYVPEHPREVSAPAEAAVYPLPTYGNAMNPGDRVDSTLRDLGYNSTTGTLYNNPYDNGAAAPAEILNAA